MATLPTTRLRNLINQTEAIQMQPSESIKRESVCRISQKKEKEREMATNSIIVTLISIFGLVASRPSILPTCNYNTYNMYMFEAFSQFSMKYYYRTTELCMEEFPKLGYNKNYCSATSILGFSSENSEFHTQHCIHVLSLLCSTHYNT